MLECRRLYRAIIAPSLLDSICRLIARCRPDDATVQGFMRLKPSVLLLSCSLLPGLSLADKTVYGLNEYVSLDDLDIEVAAKLDTGAKTASLSARDIKRFKRDGETWVRFYLAIDDAHEKPIERPLARISKIKRRAGDYDADSGKTYTARPVIELPVCMGQTHHLIEVNLTDRSAFQYPLLIGSEALKRLDAVVDPSLKYAAGKPGCNPDANSAE